MNNKPRTPFIIFFEALFLFLFFIFQFSVSPFLKIGNAFPALLLNLVLVCSFFFGSSHGAVIGLISGLLSDSTVTGSTCFYTVLLLLLGLVAGLLKEHYLNSNFRAALAVSVIFSGIYFIARWLFFYAFSSTEGGFEYLLNFAVPSLVYTCVLFLPTYFIFNIIKKRMVFKQ